MAVKAPWQEVSETCADFTASLKRVMRVAKWAETNGHVERGFTTVLAGHFEGIRDELGRLLDLLEAG
jgi:hypothetical protein